MNKKNLLLIICAIIVLLIIVWLIAVKIMDNTDNIKISTETATIDDASSSVSNSSDISDFTAEEDMLMHQMMEEMMNIEQSGSADIDFLQGMIPHHRCAIEISESYLSHNPENANMKALAQNIISLQQEEINTMNSLISSITETDAADPEKADYYQYEYTKLMHTSHSHNTNEYNSVDHAFADGMIEHHQMAVDMSNIILRYSDNEEVKALAENIISTQEEEIQEMNNFLNSLA